MKVNLPGSRSPGYAILSISVLLVLWQILADEIVKNHFILPSFTDVIVAFFVLLFAGTLPMDFAVSMIHFFIGLGLSLLVGVPAGILIGWFPVANRLLDPIIEIIRPIPPLAWIPFAIVWFGLTDLAAGFVIFIGSVFPVLVNTYEGFRNIPRIFVEAGRMLGCTTNAALIRFIALPAALPHLAAGFRVASGVAWMCLVAAEMFGVSRFGLGQKIWWYYNLHQMDKVMVYMLILGFIGLIIDNIFRYAMNRTLLKWRQGEVN
ncbi:MAG TPA: ABC transporter permease [Methanospirillum sp.]|jgi:NitT/TauT family transport system permease protein|uniref:ABC transporter permease n=1 Tax=Methanospirillum sp. TaxID=45200 RepID=UPI0009CF9984|nr:ABC transporter permease [Methanospirillum sp.]OQB36598.1 MAG: alkanesulfonate transporter permease subunit [Euryarchaeota archaeon ADurb.Bin165]HPY59991.1 ABC transporter permease [Methanospirillum sp.]